MINDDDTINEDSEMFFIVSGIYKVDTGTFDMKKNMSDQKDLDNQKPKNPKKSLTKGDYFGEVSLMYGCRRTATVKATQYS